MSVLNNVLTSSFRFSESTIKEFFEFMTQAGVMQLAVATIIGIYVNDLAKGFVDSLLSPLLNRALQGKTQKQFDDYSFNVLGVQFKIGHILILIIRLFIILFVLFMVIRFIPKYFVNKKNGG